jgi:DNA (cytosine-5)-methyltransferase 1
MDAIELFAGAGGAALGLEAAGIGHAALCEWDPDACATLRAAGLGPVVEGDVRNLDAIEAVAGASCDLLWSSFPCQAFSAAGKRLGASDDRNGWPWTVDALDRFRPRWFLGENVRGLLCHSSAGCGDPMTCPRCYLDAVILPDLRARFDHAGWFLLNAADYGVPQHRRRVILWAGPRPVRPPAPTHADPATLAQGGLFGPRLLPWVSMGEALRLNRSRVVAPNRTPARDLTDAPAPTIDNHTGVTGDKYEQAIRIVDPYLRRPSPTVSAVGEVKGSGPGGNPEKMQRASDALYLGTGRRRLTVDECARLQDFPANHPWQGTKTARYRQVGNAVPPTLARVVAEAVIAADRGE